MERRELIELVTELYNSEGKTEEEENRLLELLEKNVPHPEVSDLIYWHDLTPEEVVDRALAYRSIQLGGGL
jgi:hypothetical protein